MNIMRKLPVFLVVMSLIVGSLFSATHSHAASISDDGVQIVKCMDDNDSGDSTANSVSCHQCCHAGSHIILNQQNGDVNLPVSQKSFFSRGESYLSQLNSPPFQPPRA